jgi:uridylate kinase
MNALALQDAFEGYQVSTKVMSAISVNEVCEPYIRRKAISHLEKGNVVIIAAGTGNPYFSTDTAAVLRALELDIPVVLMAKNGNIEGVYDKDPNVHKEAIFLPKITFRQMIDQKLAVIDLTSCTIAEENDIKLIIFNIHTPDCFLRAAMEEKIGTEVTK